MTGQCWLQPLPLPQALLPQEQLPCWWCLACRCPGDETLLSSLGRCCGPGQGCPDVCPQTWGPWVALALWGPQAASHVLHPWRSCWGPGEQPPFALGKGQGLGSHPVRSQGIAPGLVQLRAGSLGGGQLLGGAHAQWSASPESPFPQLHLVGSQTWSRGRKRPGP